MVPSCSRVAIYASVIVISPCHRCAICTFSTSPFRWADKVVASHWRCASASVTILVILKERITPIPTIQHMINRAHILHSQLPRPAGNLAQSKTKWQYYITIDCPLYANSVAHQHSEIEILIWVESQYVSTWLESRRTSGQRSICGRFEIR